MRVTDESKLAELNAKFDAQKSAAPENNIGMVTDENELARLNAKFDHQRLNSDQSEAQAASPVNPPEPEVLSAWGQVGRATGNFMEDMSASYNKNINQMTDTFARATGLEGEQAAMTGGDPRLADQSSGQTAWQVAANPINLLFDTAGNFLKMAGTEVYEILPEHSQEQLAANWEGIKQMPEIQLGMKALRQGADAWDAFEKGNPAAARTLASGFDVYGLLAGGPKPVRPLPEVEITPYRVKRSVQGVGKRNEAAPAKGYEKDVYNIVREPATNANKQATAAQTTQPSAVRRAETDIPSIETWDMVDAAKKAGVAGSLTMRQNLKRIAVRIDKLNNRLVDSAKGKDVLVNRASVASDMRDRTIAELDANPGWGKNRYKRSEDVLNQATTIMNRHDNTLEGVLAARREFDQWVERYYGENVFTGNKANVVNTTVRQARDAMNDELKRQLPGSADLLDEMHQLYKAHGNVLPKAAHEAQTLVGRIGQNLALVMPKSPLGWLMMGSMAASAGLPAVMGGALAIPFAVGAYGVGKKAMYSIPMRKATGAAQYTLNDVLRELNKAIKASAGNDQMLRQLKADRALLIGMMSGDDASEQ